jgi:division protein CdvB (Snf7/Vps24/ESCRT-III family)
LVLRIFRRGRRGEGLRRKISTAVKKIEAHRRELESLKLRLEARRKALFETAVRALRSKDEEKASVYANEHAELTKVIRVLSKSELALTQIIVRLESIRDVGDIMYQMTAAFKVMKSVSKTVSGLIPAIETAGEEVNSTLSQTLAELGKLSPTISFDVRTDSGEDIFERAKLYAEQKAMELQELPSSLLSMPGEGIVEKAKKVALLATGEEPNVANNDTYTPKPILLTSRKSRKVEELVYKYAQEKGGISDVIMTARELGLPVDEVERAVLELASRGKLRLDSNKN